MSSTPQPHDPHRIRIIDITRLAGEVVSFLREPAEWRTAWLENGTPIVPKLWRACEKKTRQLHRLVVELSTQATTSALQSTLVRLHKDLVALLGDEFSGNFDKPLDVVVSLRQATGNPKRLELSLARIEQTVAALSSEGDRTDEATEACPEKDAHIIHRKDEKWTIVYNGEKQVVKHRKWMPALQELLLSPDREFHVTELVRIVDPEFASQERDQQTETSADDRSLSEYEGARQRLIDERDAAEHDRKLERMEEIDKQIEHLEAEFSRAKARTGKSRAKADPYKKLRQNATKGLQACVGDFEDRFPALHEHLTKYMTYGTRVVYRPPPATCWTT